MKYAVTIAPNGAQGGQWVDDGQDPIPHQVALADAEPMPGQVWDASAWRDATPAEVSARDLETLKTARRDEVRARFEAQFVGSIEAEALNWHAGERSASRLNGAVSLAQALSETQVRLTDYQDVEHTVPVASALTVAAAVGRHWRDRFYQRQALMRTIDTAPTTAELTAVVLPVDWT